MVAHRGYNWQLSPSLIALEAEADALAPNRSRASDGSIGDAAHSARTSDHNPDGGFVDAIDITHDPANGMDIHALLRRVAARGDRRVKYLISNGQIHNPSRGDPPGRWRVYTGSNPHRRHGHISVLNSGRVDTSPWFATEPQPPARPVPATTTEGADMFLGVEGLGFFAIIDGVPVSLGGDLASFARVQASSPGTPTMVLPRGEGEYLINEIIRKHAKVMG